ncbi:MULTISPECIES: ankyrin repeat domain-containing protein [Campylobacter]|uniref:ankyrin repeat domain-containing protein n=1 Tax=Campylobacter TaxID=194 RepID=UPI001473C63C|nr:ankyrin repeat domain-containing protein [Campylobacter sp. RM12916]MBE3022894.1 ankyrin repeat domain-containing protein [Campylobacter sp. 7477a]MBE3610546.1 ankyrin repeat domain-containing protein [Campylobacter sp. RM12916]
MKRLFLLFLLVFAPILLYALEFGCEELKNPKEFFKTKPQKYSLINDAIFYCDGSLLNLEHVNALFEVAKKIRGENRSCVGDSVYEENLNKFKWLLLEASFAPEIYAKSLKTPNESEEQKDAQMVYFRYWGTQSLYNFLKRREFLKLYNEAQTPLVKYYEQRGQDFGSAAYYATSVVNAFLTFAVGSEHKVKFDITPEQKMIIDKTVGYEQISSMLYSKSFSAFELSNMLNTALLYEREISVLEQILKRGADINFGDETALFYALKNLKNVEFLLKNGADVNHKNIFGKSVLFYAVQFGDVALTKFLLENGANANDFYIDQNTKNAILNLGDENFYNNTCALEHTLRSVFMHAASHANVEILELLIKHGADIYAVDELGFNAMDYAIINANEQNIKFLQDLKLEPKIK